MSQMHRGLLSEQENVSAALQMAARVQVTTDDHTGAQPAGHVYVYTVLGLLLTRSAPATVNTLRIPTTL